VWLFGELLDLPSVSALGASDQAQSLTLLQLFAYGTFADYKGERVGSGVGGPTCVATRTVPLQLRILVPPVAQMCAAARSDGRLTSDLDEGMLRKLKQLSLITIAATRKV